MHWPKIYARKRKKTNLEAYYSFMGLLKNLLIKVLLIMFSTYLRLNMAFIIK